MDDAVALDRTPERRWRPRPDWPRRLLNELLVLLLAVAFLLSVGLVLLDTAPGHRFIVDRIAQIETASGLRFKIGRIDGSIFGESRLKNVEIADQQGVFLTSPEIELDWSPAAYFFNKLSIDRVAARRMTLLRVPKFRRTGRTGPILPSFDIHIGELEIERLELAPAVSGVARVGRVTGNADVRSGKAEVELNIFFDRGGDRIIVALDAEPDGDRFDVDVRATSPANGLLPAIFGSKRAMGVTISGEGTWRRWRGKGALDLSGQPAARLNLTADAGRFGLSGALAPSKFLKGKPMRLTAPVIRVSGDGTLADRILTGQLTLGSPSLRAVAAGQIDLAENRYRRVRVGVDLLRPTALFPNMTGRNIRLLWTLDGPFAGANYSYRLTAPLMKFDNTGFVDVRAEGRGQLTKWPMRVPLTLNARAITGVGDVAGSILARAKLVGILTVTPSFVRGENLQLTSDKVRSKVALLIDLVTGRFEVLLSGGINRYLIDGIGIVDVTTDLKVVPGPNGKGSRVVGTAKASVRRLDNSFFVGLTGGLPRIETNLERGSDGIVHFTNLQFYSPKLRLSGAGRRNRDGTFHIEARGRQAQYGPLRMVLDGRIERPKVELLLDSPNEAMGLKDVRLSLDPTSAGFDYRALGQSRLGPFASNGRILLPRGGRAVISVAALSVSGTTARGDLRSDPGGFTGTLAVAGGGLGGNLIFSPVGNDQKIEAHLAASNVRFPGSLAVRSGRLDGTIVLAEGQTTLQGVLDARGFEMSGISLARITANARLVNGSGEVRAALAGRRGAAFDLTAVAQVTPDRIRLTGRGSIERRPIELREAAVLTRDGDGWALAPTDFSFGGGRGTLSGRSGSRPEVHAQLQSMPLELLNIGWPNLDLRGLASGRLDYAWKGNRNGRANLTIRGLSRSGLVLSSKPIDVGVAAVISGSQAAIRAVAVSDGRTIGRAQAKFAPLGGGSVLAELLDAPLFAQLRYAGAADTLWRLTGSEILDLSGPIAIGADITGRLVDPQIRGSLRTQTARLDSAVTGMAIQQLQTEARFSGPRLIFSRIAGRTDGGGSISGSGSITFSGGKTLLDLDFNADQALLLDRDDIAARVTGPLSISSNAQGGTIAGALGLTAAVSRLAEPRQRRPYPSSMFATSGSIRPK